MLIVGKWQSPLLNWHVLVLVWVWVSVNDLWVLLLMRWITIIPEDLGLGSLSISYVIL